MKLFIKQHLFYTITKWIYPDEISRACAFAAEAAELWDKIYFREVIVISEMRIISNPEGGYIVNLESNHDEE
jgi:hypothetical protein